MIEAFLTRNTEIGSEMDPYVLINYGGKKYKTTVQDEAGKHPVWNESFSIYVTNLNDTVKVIVKE